MGIGKYEPHFLSENWIYWTGQLFKDTDFGELWKLGTWISWCSDDNSWVLNASSSILVVDMSQRFYRLDGSDQLRIESNWDAHHFVPHQMVGLFLISPHLFAIQSAEIFQLQVHPSLAVSVPKFASPVPQEISHKHTASARGFACGADQCMLC